MYKHYVPSRDGHGHGSFPEPCSSIPCMFAAGLVTTAAEFEPLNIDSFHCPSCALITQVPHHSCDGICFLATHRHWYMAHTVAAHGYL